MCFLGEVECLVYPLSLGDVFCEIVEVASFFGWACDSCTTGALSPFEDASRLLLLTLTFAFFLPSLIGGTFEAISCMIFA